MKFLARLRSRGKKRSKLFRYSWKITLVGLIVAGGLALLLFYGAGAASFDMQKVAAVVPAQTGCAFRSMKFPRFSSTRCWRAKTHAFINIPELIGVAFSAR